MKNISKIAEEFFVYGKSKDCPIYDLHGHMGTWYGQNTPANTTEKMAKAMKEANVRRYVFCHSGGMLPDAGNISGVLEARKYPGLMRVYCGINPNYPEISERDLKDFDKYKDVYVGIKMLADYHGQPITHSGYKKAWEFANKRKLLVLLHTWGGSKFNGPEQIEECAKKYPGCKILMGHSCHGEWDKAIRLVNKYKNVYFELCAVMDERGVLEKFIGETGSEKMVFGTDFPQFSYHYYIGAILAAAPSEEDKKNIFYRNAKKLLGEN